MNLNRMKTMASCSVVLMAIASVAVAEITKLAVEDRRILDDWSRFRELHKVTDLPRSVFTLCADENGRLAEPGEKW